MKIEMLCCTDQGLVLAKKLAGLLAKAGHSCTVSRSSSDLPAGRWAAERFDRADALVFVAASGIAIRAVAPHLKSKLTDPAVLAMDAAGRYVIPLLSGHVGGANRLARQIEALIGAEAVITTGTDRLGYFSPDEWAAGQGLIIANPGAIVSVSAALIRGESIKIYSDFAIEGQPPGQVCLVPGGTEAIPSDETAPHMVISCRAVRSQGALHLIPPALTLGVGCRKGVSADAIELAVQTTLDQAGYDLRAICRVASIDLKANEPGLLDFCARYDLPLVTYPAATLAALPGDFTPSAFVQKVTGVDNVCERSALSEGGTLLMKKTTAGGVALALAGMPFPLSFEEPMV
jgi:cobalt-precorrin 5A hydrolase